MRQRAELTADMAADQPGIWQDTSQAQIFVTRFSAYHHSDVWLLDEDGKLLASNDPDDVAQLGQPLDSPNLPAALAGEDSVRRNYSLNLRTEIVEVMVPVPGPDQEVVGVVGLSQELAHVHDRFLRLRYLIVGVLVVELLLGVILGLALALRLERPIRRVTQAIHGVASGQEWTTLPESGPRPIGALHSAIQALLSGADEDPALRRELLEGMDAQAQRLHPLLDNLAELHGQVLGTLELNRQPTPLGDWLRRTISPWREAAHAKGLHWQISIPDSLPALDIDADRMAQVLGNLLSNAIKYTPEGTVSVEAKAEDDGVSIVVSDTGIGIAPADQAHVFEPFYRSHRSERFPQGMGLGLTIAHDLVVAHGGRLEVDSQPDRGSRFTIWLPRT
jgi:signal transduction histidine kinase